MTAPVVPITSAPTRARERSRARLINPVTGYALAVVVSGAVWALLLSALF